MLIWCTSGHQPIKRGSLVLQVSSHNVTATVTTRGCLHADAAIASRCARRRVCDARHVQ